MAEGSAEDLTHKAKEERRTVVSAANDTNRAARQHTSTQQVSTRRLAQKAFATPSAKPQTRPHRGLGVERRRFIALHGLTKKSVIRSESSA